MELVTRFLIFRKFAESELATVGDISDFLNDHLEELDGLRARNRAVEERAFRETFRFICSRLEDSAFRRYDKNKDRFLGSFLISAFEVVALGVGYNADDKGVLQPIPDFVDKVKSVWTNPVFTDNSGSGVRASVRIPKIVPLGRKLFSK
jgi:hypothetical protein